VNHQVYSRDIDEFFSAGPGLAFLTYPTALSLLPAPQLWNALFFFLTILVAVDSQVTLKLYRVIYVPAL